MSSGVLDAMYLTARDYPGGAKTLAVRMGVNPAVFSMKLNPNNREHQLYVLDMMAILTMTGDHRALHAMNIELGYEAFPLPVIADENSTEAIAETCRDFADFLHCVSESLADGKITALELKKIRQELTQFVAQAGKLESILAGMEARNAFHV